ncbi:MAG: helix-turn-helix transcriptional regulator [Pseudomonadota bacterium]
MNSDFARNLRVLTDHYQSVAEVSRRIGINRSQFNKYLSGRSAPSRHRLKTICDFFGVEEFEIFLPHGKFEKLVGLKPIIQADGGGTRPYLSHLDRLVGRSREDLSEYEGFYFEYSYSMTAPGLILRSLLKLSGEDGVMTYQRLENMARWGSGARRVKCKYRGLAFYLNDRIFLTDYDSLTGNEISQTVLYPNYRSRLTRLSGLKLGVSTGNRREPLCARVVIESLGRRLDARRALRACGLFEPNSPEIDREIEAMVVNSMDPGTHHFRVVGEA